MGGARDGYGERGDGGWGYKRRKRETEREREDEQIRWTQPHAERRELSMQVGGGFHMHVKVLLPSPTFPSSLSFPHHCPLLISIHHYIHIFHNFIAKNTYQFFLKLLFITLLLLLPKLKWVIDLFSLRYLIITLQII